MVARAPSPKCLRVSDQAWLEWRRHALARHCTVAELLIECMAIGLPLLPPMKELPDIDYGFAFQPAPKRRPPPALRERVPPGRPAGTFKMGSRAWGRAKALMEAAISDAVAQELAARKEGVDPWEAARAQRDARPLVPDRRSGIKTLWGKQRLDAGLIGPRKKQVGGKRKKGDAAD